jgi:hypothetical protein
MGTPKNQAKTFDGCGWSIRLLAENMILFTSLSASVFKTDRVFHDHYLERIMKASQILVTTICLLCLALSVNAGFLTSNTIVNPTTIDFSTQPTVEAATGPIQIGTPVGLDIEFSGIPNDMLFTNPESWGLIDNGSWEGGTFLAIEDARPGSMLIAFNSGPVSAVGAFMNYCPSSNCGVGDLEIAVLDQSMGVLETYNVTELADIVTPDAINGGAFRGIDRPNADIYYFEISGVLPVLDDLSFAEVTVGPPPVAPVSVPTLSAWAMMMLIIVLMLVGVRLAGRRNLET